MKSPRIIVLAVLLIIAVALVAISAYALSYSGNSSTTPYQPSSNSSGNYGYYPNGMMGGRLGSGMMGSWMSGNSGTYSAAQSPVSAQNPIFPLVGYGALIGAVFAGTGGIAYFLASPKKKTLVTATERKAENTQSADNPYTSVSKTLTAQERRVLDVLVSHDGKYLQKHIRAETGLSRLKTHRIVARLAERGIVTLEKSGNTNEVRLSSWLTSKPEANTISQREKEMQEVKVKS